MIKPDRSTLEIIAAIVCAYFIFLFPAHYMYLERNSLSELNIHNLIVSVAYLSLLIFLGYLSCSIKTKDLDTRRFLVKWNNILFATFAVNEFFKLSITDIRCAVFFAYNHSPADACFSESFTTLGKFITFSGFIFLGYAVWHLIKHRIEKQKDQSETKTIKPYIYFLLIAAIELAGIIIYGTTYLLHITKII